MVFLTDVSSMIHRDSRSFLRWTRWPTSRFSPASKSIACLFLILTYQLCHCLHVWHRRLPPPDAKAYRDYIISERFESVLAAAPLFIQQYDLQYLSMVRHSCSILALAPGRDCFHCACLAHQHGIVVQIASTQYAVDFRTGSSSYARGALMARDVDDEIQLRSNGTRYVRRCLQLSTASSFVSQAVP